MRYGLTTERFQLVALTFAVCALIERSLYALSTSYTDINPVSSPTTIASPERSKLIDVIFEPLTESIVVNGVGFFPNMSWIKIWLSRATAKIGFKLSGFDCGAQSIS